MNLGRIGQLACWEHYNPLARYAMMADGEQIHSAMYPGSIFGDLFSEQTQVNIRQHALESACFVVCATAWLDPDQQAQIVKDTGGAIGAISSGCFTAIVAPDSTLLCEPIRSGEGIVIADLDFTLIEKRKQMMDSRGHYSRPELLSLLIDRAVVHGAIGASDLMEFMRFDSGDVLRKERRGQGPKMLRLVVGNPLIMKEMAKAVPDAASYAPVTILIDERANGVHLSYDLMASLLAPYGSEAALVVARDLDTKVETLLEAAAR